MTNYSYIHDSTLPLEVQALPVYKTRRSSVSGIRRKRRGQSGRPAPRHRVLATEKMTFANKVGRRGSVCCLLSAVCGFSASDRKGSRGRREKIKRKARKDNANSAKENRIPPGPRHLSCRSYRSLVLSFFLSFFSFFSLALFGPWGWVLSPALSQSANISCSTLSTAFCSG